MVRSCRFSTTGEPFVVWTEKWVYFSAESTHCGCEWVAAMPRDPTANTGWMPARANPRLAPPHPEKKSASTIFRLTRPSHSGGARGGVLVGTLPQPALSERVHTPRKRHGQKL